MLFVLIISTRASSCASSDSGMCTAIWSPSKSALKAAQTNGCSWIALPSISTGSKAWMPRRCGVGPRIDERLEQFERHLLRQPALVQLQLRTDHDHRAAGIVDALAEQVLPEAALFALQHVGERLQRALVGAGDDAAAAAVVEQRIDRLLQHPLLVADDDVRRAQLDQPLQEVVAV